MLDTTWCQQLSSWCCCHCHQSLRHYFVFYFKFEFLYGWAAAWAARQMHRSYNTLQQAVGGETVCHPSPVRHGHIVSGSGPPCAHSAMFGTLLLTLRDVDCCHKVSPATNYRLNIARCLKPSFSLSMRHRRSSFRAASFSTSVNCHLV